MKVARTTPKSKFGIALKSFIQLFKPKCPDCGSKDNTVECYASDVNPKRTETGRQCNNCVNFWFS